MNILESKKLSCTRLKHGDSIDIIHRFYDKVLDDAGEIIEIFREYVQSYEHETLMQYLKRTA